MKVPAGLLPSKALSPGCRALKLPMPSLVPCEAMSFWT